MGEVWRARDERLERYVALKVLPREVAGDPERRARMLREARAAAAIRHANVVTLFDILSHESGDLLVMELVEGRTMSEILRSDGRPSLELALRWIVDVADALVAAHAQKILHRDIKAANVMVGRDGVVKVLDFGLAKVWDEGGEPGTSSRWPAGELHLAPSASDATPGMSSSRVALDATLPSESGAHTAPGGAELSRAAGSTSSNESDRVARHEPGYETQAGALLGTPLYMSPEQVAGQPVDERSEVFSVGVLAYELLVGRPPYAAATLERLFKQIVDEEPPRMTDVPEIVETIVRRALAKDPASRFPSMKALRDACAAERDRRFARRPRRWPLAVALAAVSVSLALGLYAWHAGRAPSVRPGDSYVQRALEEYDLFYNDKALSSLRAALRVAPDHPRANAYMILFGSAPPEDREAALAAARRVVVTAPARGKDRALLAAALAYSERGAADAKQALLGSGASRDRELRYWAAALDWRSGEYASARDGFRLLVDSPARQFRGRIYDLYSSLLIYFDVPDEALRIGTLYRDAFPGEADAVAVYATTLAMVGRYEEAVRAAEDALRLHEGEDTLAGLGKVLALRGERERAKEMYRRSVERAGEARRPLRRAALGFLQWIDGELDAARHTVAPCLAGGAEASVRERGACLFIAGILDPARNEQIATQLDQLAAEARPTRPAYGNPASLAALVRARATFFGGACLTGERSGVPAAADESAYGASQDFYATYHLPFFASWAVCEHASLLAARGDRAAAASLLRPIASRAPGRRWLLDVIESLEGAGSAGD